MQHHASQQNCTAAKIKASETIKQTLYAGTLPVARNVSRTECRTATSNSRKSTSRRRASSWPTDCGSVFTGKLSICFWISVNSVPATAKQQSDCSFCSTWKAQCAYSGLPLLVRLVPLLESGKGKITSYKQPYTGHRINYKLPGANICQLENVAIIAMYCHLRPPDAIAFPT